MPDRSSVALAAIALGSNLDSPRGDRADNLRAAIEGVAELGRVTAVSSFFDTEPQLYMDQPRFLNAALLLETSLTPETLMLELLDLERRLGRDRTRAAPAKGPRIIDLDLLLFGEVVRRTPELTLPHPAMHERRFVLEPLAQIAPDWRHPMLGKTVRELLALL